MASERAYRRPGSWGGKPWRFGIGAALALSVALFASLVGLDRDRAFLAAHGVFDAVHGHLIANPGSPPGGRPSAWPTTSWPPGISGGSSVRALELKVPPLALVALFAAAMWAASALPPRDAWAWRWRMPLAFLLAIAGGGIAMAGVAAFRKARTTVDPTKPGHASAMVTSGVYRFSRNPMYLGFLLLLLAWAVRLSHPLAFVFLPAFVLSMNRLQIAPEERALEGKFGSEFTAYRQSVRRWL